MLEDIARDLIERSTAAKNYHHVGSHEARYTALNVSTPK